MSDLIERLRRPVTRINAEVALLAEAAGTAADEIERLTACLKKANDQAEHFEREWYLRGDEIERLTAELETERMRLTACGVAALANTADSAARARDIRPEYRSASLDDVERAVDREIQLRDERDELRRQLAEAEMDAERYRWLRNEANTARKCDPMVCIYPLDEQDLIDGDRLDVAIDAAMGLTRPAEE